MKNRIYTMKGMLATLRGAFLLGYAVTGCIDEKDHYKPEDKTSQLDGTLQERLSGLRKKVTEIIV